MAANKYLVESYDQMLGRGQDKSMEAFVKGATGVLANKAKQEAQSIAAMQEGHEKDMENLEKLGDLGTLSRDEKQVAKEWFRNKRDEYYNLSTQFQKTKDPALQDKMDDINEAILNVGNNVKRYNENTLQWGQDIGKVAYGSKTFDGETIGNIYGKKGTHRMSFDEYGGMNFVGKITDEQNEAVLAGEQEPGAKVVSLNDIDGGWNLRNSTVEAFERDMRSNLESDKKNGKFFSKTKRQGDMYSKLVESGPEGVQVFAETDLTGTYGNTDLSFKKLWEDGALGDEAMYSKFPKDGGSDWMYDDANSDYLAGLISKHIANTHETMYNDFSGPTQTYESQAGTAGERDATRKMNQSMAKYEEDLGSTANGSQNISGLYNTEEHHNNVASYFNTRLKKGYGLEFINGDKGLGYYITEQVPDFSDPLNPTYTTKKSFLQSASLTGGNTDRKWSTHLKFENIWRFMDQDMITLTSDNNIMFKKD